MTEDSRRLLLFTFIVTGSFFFAAHGYRFSNNMFSHDSLMSMVRDDHAWQIALGRIFIPVLMFLRGSVSSPWLISMAGFLWISLSVFFTVRLFGVEDRISIAAVAGIFTCNPTVTALSAAFIEDFDFYLLACFLSILGVWFFKQFIEAYINMDDGRHYDPGHYISLVPGMVSITVSMGIYQAYVSMTAGCLLILLFRQAAVSRDLKRLVKGYGIVAAGCIISAVLYFLMWKACQGFFHIWTADSYNGLAALGNYADTSVLGLITQTYKRTFMYFLKPDVFSNIVFRGHSLSIIWRYILVLVNVSLMAAAAVKSFVYGKNLPPIITASFLLLLPFAVNIVCFLSKGLLHTLMMFPINLVYVYFILMMDEELAASGKKIKKLYLLPLALVIWSSIVFANQAYLKKDLMYQAADSLLTRIVLDVEHVEGYIPGVTPVAIFGSFEDNPHIHDLEGFEEISFIGMGKTSLSYVGLDYLYLKHILNVDMNLVRISPGNPAAASLQEQIAGAPPYPGAGSVFFAGDTIIVKIADN